VSVTEIAPRGEEFERTPPHDLAAEQCVLGGMLMSKDAISDVLEVIRPSDHYRPAHQLVHEVILDLYGRGEPADAVTVANELTKRGEIARVGGAPYLHTLIACVPTAANAGYYARIVRERAILRRLVEAGTRIVQLGYSGDGEADEIVDRAEAEVYGVTDRRVSEDYLALSEIMPGALNEIEAIGSRGGALTGVPTGFADLDSLTNGLHPGQMIVIAARPALGKALGLDTPLPTPTGWTTMGEVAIGDQLIGAAGTPVNVVAAGEVMQDRPCYEVEFCTGEVIVADGQHQWLTWRRPDRRGDDRAFPAVMTTEQIAAALQGLPSAAHPDHAVPTCGPLDLPEAQLPIPPYVLGVWLGSRAVAQAGCSLADPEIAMRVEGQGFSVLGRPSLPGGDQTGIPLAYRRASEVQRRALLAGILDVTGAVASNGAIRLTLTGRRLAHDVRELVTSLGYRCALPHPGEDEGSYLVQFLTDDQVFLLTRKHRLHKERLRQDPRQIRWHDIVGIRPVPSRPVRCVQVDSADRLYLAGEGMIPTHNSTLALDLARAASVKAGLTSVIFSLEMSRNEITMRLLSAEARVPLHSMRTGQMGEEDWTRLARRMSEVVDAPMFIDDSPNMSMMEIRAKCRRLKQRHDLRLVVIDYLQLMSSPKRVENRQQEVSDMSRSLKLLAKELNVPVVAVAQLNRGPEQRTDKRPLLADLRESGCLTEDTTVLRADTGAPVTLRTLIDGDHQEVLVWSVDDQRHIAAAPMTNVFSSGVKEVFRLRLESGREVKASGNHPFLTSAGWVPLERLAVGNRIGVLRRVPEPVGSPLGWTEHRLGLLAHLIGEGRVLCGHPISYISTKNNAAFVEKAAAAEFGVMPRRIRRKRGWHTYLPSPYPSTHGRYSFLRVWLKELGIEGLRSHQRRIPDVIYSASNHEIAVFLRHLWATGGCVTVPRGKAEVHYASSSRELADGVALLLARFGIVARIRCIDEPGRRPGFWVIIEDGPSLVAFCSEIGVYGRAVTLDSPALQAGPANDIYWDQIVSIESIGPRPVFDATVKGTHNFIANGIHVHNSIEQDSDVVILLHREDAYERESPRAGEADFIVAKHRNGPTATVTVAFQGHYSRFTDMARI